MSNIATTKLSSKGQVVIPEEIREKLGLKTGAQFVVLGQNDAVVLKLISPPSIDEFDKLIASAKKQARQKGLKKKDIDAAIKKVRKSK